MKQIGPYWLESTLCRDGAVTYSAVHVPSGGKYLLHVLEIEDLPAVLARLELAKTKGLPVVTGQLDGIAVAVTPVLPGFVGLDSWLHKAQIATPRNFALVTGPVARKLEQLTTPQADPASPCEVTDPRARFAKLVSQYSSSGAIPVARPPSNLASGATTTPHHSPSVVPAPESEYSRIFLPVRPTASFSVPPAPTTQPTRNPELERLRLWAFGGWATSIALGLLLLASILGRWRSQ